MATDEVRIGHKRLAGNRRALAGELRRRSPALTSARQCDAVGDLAVRECPTCRRLLGVRPATAPAPQSSVPRRQTRRTQRRPEPINRAWSPPCSTATLSAKQPCGDVIGVTGITFPADGKQLFVPDAPQAGAGMGPRWGARFAIKADAHRPCGYNKPETFKN